MTRKKQPPPEPPDYLSEAARELWRKVVTSEMSDGKLALLQIALEAFDRAGEASALLRTEGLTMQTATSGAVHVHPAVKIERDNRALFVRVWTVLGFAKDEPGWY
jgi:P27 family predicted phage terminase small subunit